MRLECGAILLCAIFVTTPGVALAGTDYFIYDALGRVVSVISQNGKTTSYVYDAAGNRKTVVTVSNAAVNWGSFNWNNASWHN